MRVLSYSFIQGNIVMSDYIKNKFKLWGTVHETNMFIDRVSGDIGNDICTCVSRVKLKGDLQHRCIRVLAS